MALALKTYSSNFYRLNNVPYKSKYHFSYRKGPRKGSHPDHWFSSDLSFLTYTKTTDPEYRQWGSPCQMSQIPLGSQHCAE